MAAEEAFKEIAQSLMATAAGLVLVFRLLPDFRSQDAWDGSARPL